MKSNMKIGFIGAGNMAGAIIDAIFASEILLPEQMYLYDPSAEKRERYRLRGLIPVSSNSDIVNICDIIILAVKPQVMDEILYEIKCVSHGKCFVSIAAGISTDHIRNILGNEIQVIRVLPNTPMLVLKGATVIAEPEAVDAANTEFIEAVFKAAGEVVFLDEKFINSVIPVSSSSPAFFFRMIKAMVQCGEAHGIDYDTSIKLAVATMHGAAHILEESGKTPDELIAQVSSPGGTTVAALSAFDEFGYERLIENAFLRCINRAEELGGK